MNCAGLTANFCRATALVASLLTASCCQRSETTGEFTYEESPSTATLRGVVSLDGLTAVAVGDGGTIVLRDGSPSEGTWTISDAEVTADLFAITAPDRYAGPALAVGASGTILRGFTGGGWLTRVSGVSSGFGDRGPSDEQREPLLAVDGDSHNAIAVGVNGTIVRAALTTTPGCQ